MSNLVWEKCDSSKSHADYRGFRLHSWLYGIVCIHPWPEGHTPNWWKAHWSLANVPTVPPIHLSPLSTSHTCNGDEIVGCVEFKTAEDACAAIDALWAKSLGVAA